ncbi:MAG: PIN domain-containing protein [Candidatus Lokiarchaeota archaeon]|nr:PIN domain-containing protein [Candidatus Lokiarchaeota archaeon]
MIILDTSACIDYLNGDENLYKIIEEQDSLIHITAITIYEINIGLKRTKRKISDKRYKFLHKKWLEFINGMQVFPLGTKEAEEASRIYDYLESTGNLIEDNDILIAGIMLSNNIEKIITKNVKHLSKIKELEIISY